MFCSLDSLAEDGTFCHAKVSFNQFLPLADDTCKIASQAQHHCFKESFPLVLVFKLLPVFCLLIDQLVFCCYAHDPAKPVCDDYYYCHL